MILVAYRQTMAGAQPVNDPIRPTPRRDRVVALSLRWQKEQRQDWQALVDADRRYGRLLHSPPVPILDYTPPEELIARVAWWHGLTSADILATDRGVVKIAEARHDAIVAVVVNCRNNHKKLKTSYVGYLFKRDRTTVLHSLSRRGMRPSPPCRPFSSHLLQRPTSVGP
jgi:hypothetical protein